MAIANIEYGNELRPTVVQLMKKMNEVIGAVNGISHVDIENDISELQSQVASANTRLDTLNNSISANTAKITANTSDIDKIKITLYTPVAENDTTE